MRAIDCQIKSLLIHLKIFSFFNLYDLWNNTVTAKSVDDSSVTNTGTPFVIVGDWNV